MTQWIGVDLDGTLAHYDGWQGVKHIGDPIPRMVERVKEWIAQGYIVKVMTARVSEGPGQQPVVARQYIEAWCEEHIGVRLAVTNAKDFGMIELWDDRAIHVKPNTGMGYGLSRVEGKGGPGYGRTVVHS